MHSKVQETSYVAVIFDENGADLGPADITGARDDEQARRFAKRAGMKWLAENGRDRATIRVSQNGYWLPVVEVHT